MSESDFRGRLLGPVIVRPRRPLSNRTSTASCSIRFSLRIIISGASSSISRFKRLLRLITLRYRSFKSEVAKRPPSSGTRGRRSGGRTGITSRIIHSGRLPESRNASTTFKRLPYLARLVLEPVSFISLRSMVESSGRLRSLSISRMASAPIPTLN